MRSAKVRSGVPIPISVIDVAVTLTDLTDNRVQITPDLQSPLPGRCSVELEVLVKPGSSPNKAIEVSWNNGQTSGSGDLQFIPAQVLRIGQMFTSYHETVTLTIEDLDENQQSVVFSLPSLPITRNWDADQFQILAAGHPEILVDWTDIGRLDGSVTVRKRHVSTGYRCRLRVLPRLAFDSLGLHPGWNLSLLQRKQAAELPAAQLPAAILDNNVPVVVVFGGLISVVAGLDQLDYAQPEFSVSFLSQPVSANADESTGTFQIEIQKANGDRATTFAGTAVATLTVPGGATLSGTTTVAVTAGLATITGLSVDTAGDYTFTISVSGAVSANSSSFTITAAAFDHAVNFGADLYDWWRADLGTTLETTRVIGWTGQYASKELANVGGPGAGDRPTYNAAGINGQPTIDFDGVDDNLNLSYGTTLAQPLTHLSVFIATGWSGGSGHLFDTKFFGSVRQRCFNSADTLILNAGNSIFADSIADWEDVALTQIAGFNGVSSTLYRNGGTNLASGGDAGADGMDGLALGMSNGGASLLNHKLAERIVLTAVPSTAAMNAWLDYVQDRYAISYTEIS